MKQQQVVRLIGQAQRFSASRLTGCNSYLRVSLPDGWYEPTISAPVASGGETTRDAMSFPNSLKAAIPVSGFDPSGVSAVEI